MATNPKTEQIVNSRECGTSFAVFLYELFSVRFSGYPVEQEQISETGILTRVTLKGNLTVF